MKASYWKRREVGRFKAIHPQTGVEITVNAQADAKIGPDLGRELRRLPGTLSWYMALRDTAETALKNARHHEHNTEEDLYMKYREEHAEKGGKKPTETEIKMSVKRDKQMRRAFRARMNAEEMLRNLKSAVEALIEKRWALQAMVKWYSFERGTKDSA